MRRLREEPLIPLGCGVTVWALLSASKSIRRGNNGYQTNKYFRYRLYAQSFTLVAMLAGSFYYKADRLKRKDYVKLKKEREAQVKRDKWIAELEARDAEDKAWQLQVSSKTTAAVETKSSSGARMSPKKIQQDQEEAARRAELAEINAEVKRLDQERKQRQADTGHDEAASSVFGESESGGLFGIGHLKRMWRDGRIGRKQP